MPLPAIMLCIPGIAILLFIQALLCEVYHFHVSVARQKTYACSGNTTKTLQDKQCKKHERKERNTTGKSGGKTNDSGSPEPVTDLQVEPLDTNDPFQNHRSLTSTLELDEFDDSDECSHSKEDRLRLRRKSVFAESYDPAKDDEEIKIIHPKTPEEKQWLVDNLRSITLFKHLAKDQTTTLVDAMYKHPVSKGDAIMRQGDHGSTFYMVQTGIYDVFVKKKGESEKLMRTYNNGGSFGELALLYNQPRAATIVARTDGILWVLDGSTFRRIVHKITYQKRMMYENLINNVPMLKSLEPFERANLVDGLVHKSFQNNEEIIKQGEKGNGMYFIISGSVRIVMKITNNKEILLKELGSSDYFGELALVNNKPRVASAYSVGTTHLAFLDRAAFERLLGSCMDVMRRHIDEYRLSEILKDASS